MTYGPYMPLILAVALLAGCHTTDNRTRVISQGEAERVLLTRFEPMAHDFVQAEASKWAGWLAGAAGVAGILGGGGVVNAWKESRKGKVKP